MGISGRAVVRWFGLLVIGLQAAVRGATMQAAAPSVATEQQAAVAQASGVDTPAAAVDPFPPIDPKRFTAATPSLGTVNDFLKALWGYDANRLWRVFSIETTAATGVSRVTVLVADRSANAKAQSSVFFVTPDGAHAVAGDGVIDFGAKPFAENRAKLQAGADGAARGATGKALELVEFADMQCPHCKDAQASMDRLLADFPKARVVYQNFPLASIHPFAVKAAEYGVCVAQAKPDAFWRYLQAVYDTQGGLTAEEGDATLRRALIRAAMDPATVEQCAAMPGTRAKVDASVKLGESVGVDQTPMLAINGRLIPVSPASIPYESLKQIVQFQAQQDGVR